MVFSFDSYKKFPFLNQIFAIKEIIIPQVCYPRWRKTPEPPLKVILCLKVGYKKLSNTV